MTNPSDARDVIIQALWLALGREPYLTMPDRADAILAALNAAGFEIVKREEPIQKPEPDWGRRGTQPKGLCGDPPPPNGKRVASKPLPMTGPFNPFGEQDPTD